LKSIIYTFIEANRFSASDADDIIQQYSDFVQGNVSQVSEFSGFDLALCRVDKFFRDRLANNPSYAKLWAVVKIVMLLSHGQATVERGFSINKQVESDNLKEDTFRTRRVICDHVNAVGGIFNIDCFLIISYVTAMNLCNACSSDGEVLRFVTVNKASIPQFRVFFGNIVEKY